MPDKFNFDVFLSHNGTDKPAVEHIARRLRDEYNQRAWLDKWNLVPGEAWQEALEDALDESQTFAVFLGPSGIGPWENEEMRSAIEERVQDKNRRVIPVVLPDAPDNKDLKLPRFLRRATWVDFRSGLDDKEALYRLYCGITGQAPGDRGSSISPKTSTTADWHLAHPYPMPPNFTGRLAEQKMLDGWLEDDKDRLFILRALGGFGKSALIWQWINTHVDPAQWRRLVFWSFYEGDASFEHFLEEILKYLKLEVPQGQRTQVDELLKAMQAQKILLIMDGFERALRAYSSMNAAYQGDEEGKLEDNQLGCVNINAEIFLKSVCSLPGIKSKVLMTTRLTPRAVKPYGEFVQGCREEKLEAMQKEDAVAFFHKQKIKGTHSEIEAACAPYGYHPLSLRLLAGRILKDLHKPGDISVAQNIKIDGDLKQHQHHVLQVSHESLSIQEQKLLSQIACFRSPISFDTLEAISQPVPREKPKGLRGIFTKKLETGSIYTGNLESDLQDLIERGILRHDSKDKYDLHPIVRRFAYDRLTAADRRGAHERLVNYFEAVPKIEKVQTLEDLAPVIELYHHMVRAGKLDEAMDMYYHRIRTPIYFQFGSYQLAIELLVALFPNGQDTLPVLKREDAQAWALNELANACSLSGQPRRAVPLFEMHNLLRDKAGDKKNLAGGLGNAAIQQLVIGALRQAERNLRRGIDLCREIKDEFHEAVSHQELGRVLSYRGVWQEAEQELGTGLNLFEKEHNVQSECVIWSYHALRFLLIARAEPQSSTLQRQLSIKSASRALELAEEDARTASPKPVDYMRAFWLLGAACRENKDLNKAEENLSKAISICRQINMVYFEADILLNLARLRYDQKNYEEAKSLADEALTITERCGYVLQGADVNLFLAQYALDQEKDKDKAREYSEKAKQLAHCDDGPPHYYKVAYDEAQRLLEKLK
jgi:tetratricopeptide (TPR) repeat protein